MTNPIYKIEPQRWTDGIPVFSQTSDYTENYEQIARDHLEAVAHGNSNPWIPESLWNECEEATLRLIREHALPGQKILDVGVGLGRLLSKTPELQRFGMDISAAYLREAKEKGIEVCLALVEDMPYPDSMFDVIVCTDVLEHVLHLDHACARILNVLKPGGVLIVRVPNREDLTQYVSPELPYHFIHLRRFDEYALHLLFGKCFRCQVLKTEGSGIWPLDDRLKWRLPLPKWDRLMYRLCWAAGKLHAGLRRQLTSKLYHPYEMHVVVRKP